MTTVAAPDSIRDRISQMPKPTMWASNGVGSVGSWEQEGAVRPCPSRLALMRISAAEPKKGCTYDQVPL